MPLEVEAAVGREAAAGPISERDCASGAEADVVAADAFEIIQPQRTVGCAHLHVAVGLQAVQPELDSIVTCQADRSATDGVESGQLLGLQGDVTARIGHHITETELIGRGAVGQGDRPIGEEIEDALRGLAHLGEADVVASEPDVAAALKLAHQ